VEYKKKEPCGSTVMKDNMWRFEFTMFAYERRQQNEHHLISTFGPVSITLHKVTHKGAIFYLIELYELSYLLNRSSYNIL
jgi:hypothetical protein